MGVPEKSKIVRCEAVVHPEHGLHMITVDNRGRTSVVKQLTPEEIRTVVRGRLDGARIEFIPPIKKPGTSKMQPITIVEKGKERSQADVSGPNIRGYPPTSSKKHSILIQYRQVSDEIAHDILSYYAFRKEKQEKKD